MLHPAGAVGLAFEYPLVASTDLEQADRSLSLEGVRALVEQVQ